MKVAGGRFWVGVVVVGASLGCAGPDKMESAPSTLAAIQLVQTAPPAECQPIGPVSGADEKQLREAAVVRSGNYVQLESPTNGQLYRCPTAQSQGVIAQGAGPAIRVSDVKVMTSDPPPECKEVGMVSVPFSWGDQAGARERLKLRAVGMGVNYIRLELPASGTGFRCPVAEPEAPAKSTISG